MAARAPDHALPMEARLERALITASRLVALHGPAYTPFFERIESDLHAIRQRSSATERAIAMTTARPLPKPATLTQNERFIR